MDCLFIILFSLLLFFYQLIYCLVDHNVYPPKLSISISGVINSDSNLAITRLFLTNSQDATTVCITEYEILGLFIVYIYCSCSSVAYIQYVDMYPSLQSTLSFFGTAQAILGNIDGRLGI